MLKHKLNIMFTIYNQFYCINDYYLVFISELTSHSLQRMFNDAKLFSHYL